MQKTLLVLLALTMIIAGGCDKKEEDKTTAKVELIPLLLPAIKTTAPAATTPSASALATPATKEEALVAFFKDTFSGISGTSATGFINASVGDLDSRITTINGQFEKEPGCYSATPTAWTVTTGSPVNYSIDLKISCLSKFTQTNGDQSGAGSGLAWGRDDNFYYVALILFQQNLVDKFGYFATYNRTTKAVNLLFLDYSDTNSRAAVYRVKTDPSSKKFEVAMAGVNFSAGPMFPALGCNTRMISNGTELLVSGKAGETNSTGVCGTNSTFVFNDTQCFDATNVNTTTAACANLTTSSFSSDVTEFDGTQVNISKSTINTNLSFSTIENAVAAPTTN